MSDCALVTIAEAVTNLLNEQALSQTFAANRCYIPNYDIHTNPGLQLFVLSTNQVVDVTGGDRINSQDTYTLTIAIYKQLGRANGQIADSDMDAMLYFVENVADCLKQNNQQGEGSLVSITFEPVYDPAQLDKNGTFVSVIKANYLLFR